MMTDIEIMLVLEICNMPAPTGCSMCPLYKHKGSCTKELINLTLDLINRQQTEMKTLRTKLESLKQERDMYFKLLVPKENDPTAAELAAEARREQLRVEYSRTLAIKVINEFAERLNKKLNRIPQNHFSLLMVKATVEEVRKEMEADNA